MTSFSEGSIQRQRGDDSTTMSHGITVVTMMLGMLVSIVEMYSCTSESVATSPNGSPKARSEMTSSVKYCAFRAKSNGWFADTYLVSRRFSQAKMLLSIFASRLSTSLPEYCSRYPGQPWINLSSHPCTYARGHHRPQPAVYVFIALRQNVVLGRVQTHAIVPVGPRIRRPHIEHPLYEIGVACNQIVGADPGHGP